MKAVLGSMTYTGSLLLDLDSLKGEGFFSLNHRTKGEVFLNFYSFKIRAGFLMNDWLEKLGSGDGVFAVGFVTREIPSRH